jgi:hypothetical protein
MLTHDMTEALRYMATNAVGTPGRTGLSIRTFRALVRRGLAIEPTPYVFKITSEGKALAASE